MWILENNTPFPVERTWITDKRGVMHWVVVVKGTYLINPDGFAVPAEKQEEICRVSMYRGEPGTSSLIYESDFMFVKPATDIILNGHAYALDGKPCPQVDVTMKVAGITKTLRVFGDRFWEKGATGFKATAPEPFGKMSVVYERAYGGMDKRSDDTEKHGWEPRNPVGVGFTLEPENLTGQRLPNIEYPDQDFHRPAGFGPIAPHWSPRRELAGTYDETWQNERFPLVPMDFDERFYLCAPEDQQVQGHLNGGEPVALYNLTPGGLLSFELPRVSIRFVTSFYGKEDVEHCATIQTIILEPDVPRMIILWATCLSCHHDVLKLKATAVCAD